MPIKLGKEQRTVLAALASHKGVWSENGGWYWGGRARTAKFMESFVAKGLATKQCPDGWATDQYTITEEGRQLVPDRSAIRQIP